MAENPRPHSAFEAGGKHVEVYPGAAPNSPIVYLNTVAGEGGKMCEALQSMGCSDCTLVCISCLDWNHDMAPWDIPPITKGDTPCTGGADDHLHLLTGEIMPRAEALAQGNIPWRGLAGYSLAGLFALYAMYRADCFSRVASISGSLWFPGFPEYVFAHEMARRPDRVYLSLGDQERRTRNPYLKSVQDNTEAICAFFREQGMDTAFQLNPGNHFKNAVQRTAAGIAWIVGG